MTRFDFSLHAKYKFIFFKSHAVSIRQKDVIDVIRHGKITDIGELPKIEITGAFDAKHSLVVIYRQTGTGYFIITFWIAEKGRYESKIQ